MAKKFGDNYGIYQDKQGRWHYDFYRGPRCKENRGAGRNFKSYQEAFAHAEQKEKELLDRQEAARNPKMRLSDAFKRMYKERWQHLPTGEAMFRHAMKLVEILGDRELSSITRDDIEKVKSYFDERGAKAGTINRYLSKLRVTLSTAQEDWPDSKVVSPPRIKNRKEGKGRQESIKPELEEKITAILSKMAEDHHRGPKERQDCLDLIDHFYLTLDLANRPGETCKLEYKNVNWDALDGQGSIKVWMNKTQDWKEVPLTARARSILKRRMLISREKVFPNLTLIRAESLWKKMRKRLGETGMAEDVVMHHVRHTAATRMINAGVNLEYVAAMLGHKKIGTTQRYTHGDLSRLKRATAALEKDVVNG